ncbi:chorismate-binding protein [Lacinutrix chionoecetis]
MSDNNFVEIAQNHFNDALPFVLYRKPKAKVLKGLFQNNDTVYTTENLTESGFVFAPFETEKQTVLIPANQSHLLETETITLETVHNPSEAPMETSNNNLVEEKTNHINLVLKATEAIENGLFKKVVISRQENVRLIESNPIQLFKRLLSLYSTAFVYCWYHPKIGLWLGATPETLLTVTGNQFTTMALAGTQSYKGEENPEWNSKETEEQQYVTDFIVDSLNPLSEQLKVGDLKSVKAGNLLHLRTPVSGVLKSNLKAVIDALHPTPAVCGMPKQVAKQFILKNENYNREFYTGFLGELNIKETTTRNTNRRNVENNAYNAVKTVSNLFVNLRCMQLTDVSATIYVGGGITKASNAEKEWQETVNKSETMKKVLF